MVKGYFRSFGAYETYSMSTFMKRAKIGNVKSIDVIIDYIIPEGTNKSPFEDVKMRVSYEAKPNNYGLKLRFIRTYNKKNEDQNDALIFTERKINWLKKNLICPEGNNKELKITVRNTDRKRIDQKGGEYQMLLDTAKKIKKAQKTYAINNVMAELSKIVSYNESKNNNKILDEYDRLLAESIAKQINRDG